MSERKSWRSLDELAQTPEFREFLHREFPAGTVELAEGGVERRTFLKMMAAPFALAGLSACRRPMEKIVPYVRKPEEIQPGIANYYATTMPLGMGAFGLLVKSNEGRPTKIEGNPQHPSTMGAANAFLQAQILDLYDPDRAKDTDWEAFHAAWRERYAELTAKKGEGMAVLSEAFHAPTMARLKLEFGKKFPRATWVAFDAVSDETILKGAELAFGTPLHPRYDFKAASVLVSLDSDFLGTETDAIRAAKGFSEGRNLKSEADPMNRLYAIESGFGVTGATADHRIRMKSAQVASFAAALAKELVEGSSSGDARIRAIANDLKANKGKSLVLAGRNQPAEVHALVFRMNDLLGNLGKTVHLHALASAAPSDSRAFGELSAKMREGKIETLLILGGNPVYNAPADLGFAEAIKKVPWSAYLGLDLNETAKLVKFSLGQSHFLEAWGDALDLDGTPSIQQPLIAPLYKTRSALELLSFLTLGREIGSYEIVRETWKGLLGSLDFEKKWRRVLHDGVWAEGAKPPKNVAVKTAHLPTFPSTNDDLEIVFRPSPALFDGRSANNGWLQELPHPVTKVTWDNPACMSPKTAQQFSLKNGDTIKITAGDRAVQVPIWVLPGQADGSISLDLGYGRKECGRVGKGVGFDVQPLRTLATLGLATGVRLEKTPWRHKISVTQDHGSMEGRPLILEKTLADYKQNPDFTKAVAEPHDRESMWREHEYKEGNQWGMAIDLNRCIGCNACVTACQSENNIPIVGKEQVANGREMHWLRIDRYFSGGLDEPTVAFQPVACQHCEMAPCEQVCPVAATVHDKEGLNVMAYNRCIGTRYCANNCPYKVRRFNYFNFTNEYQEVEKLARNPDVTVRFRGVMEKCTFCTQRIESVKIAAKREKRPIADGEVVTACQQTCPADAIAFGNLADPKSRVNQIKERNRNYSLLAELNVRPRTSYLARIRNRNPEMGEES